MQKFHVEACHEKKIKIVQVHTISQRIQIFVFQAQSLPEEVWHTERDPCPSQAEQGGLQTWTHKHFQQA